MRNRRFVLVSPSGAEGAVAGLVGRLNPQDSPTFKSCPLFDIAPARYRESELNRLLGTTTGFTQISPTGPDGAYAFAPNTTYTGSLTITRTSATEVQLTGTLGNATHSVTDAFDSDDFGMLAFWANSNMFGTSSTPGTADNGIDFSNVKIEFLIPEPASFVLVIVGGVLAAWPRRACRR